MEPKKQLVTTPPPDASLGAVPHSDRHFTTTIVDVNELIASSSSPSSLTGSTSARRWSRRQGSKKSFYSAYSWLHHLSSSKKKRAKAEGPASHTEAVEMVQTSTINMKESEFESESVKELVSHTIERSEEFEDQGNTARETTSQTIHFESGAYDREEEQGDTSKVHPPAKMVLSGPPEMAESRDGGRGKTVERTLSCPVEKYDVQLQ